MFDEVRKALEQTNQKLCEAIRNGDEAALADLYTEDAFLLPPNTEMVRGKQATKDFWGAAMHQMGLKDADLTTVELSGSGDTANEIGNYKLTIQPEGQDPVVDKGKYVVIWKRTDKGWKLHWDIWNSSLAPQE